MPNPETIKNQIVEALSHPEAEDGLYFNNLIVVHEEEERAIVAGDEREIRSALEQLKQAGRIEVLGDGEAAIFQLRRA